MPKALFGPAMTKPTFNKDDEVTFFVSGGVLDEDNTEIYQYKSTKDGNETWKKLNVEGFPTKSLGFSLFFSYEDNGKTILVLAGGISRDWSTKSREVRIIEIRADGSIVVKAELLTHEDYFFDNQLVEQPMNIIYSVGYKYLWQYSKERRRFSTFSTDQDDVGLEGQLISSGFIMP